MAALAVPVLANGALGCTGDIGTGETDDDGGGAGTSVTPEFEPASATLHRLTRPQLEAAWADLFGELVMPADLPKDDVAYGFTSIAAARGTISSVEAEQYEKATYEVLNQVWADPARRDALVGCAFTSVNDACVRSFVEDFAFRAWRRPITADEVDALVAVGAGIESDIGDPIQGLKFSLATVLQAPHFLFRVELGEPSDKDGVLRYTDWEMASRLSFLLLDAPPDEELRTAAAAGDLSSAEGVQIQADRLLESPRARGPLVGFFRDFMMVRNLDQLKKNIAKFPQLTATLGPAMRVEIERMFENVVFEKQADFRELFTTRQTYLNEELARLYGVEGITGADFRPVTLPADSGRSGLLTTVGFLSMNAHETQTSPTHRGRFVQINLLCNDIPPPPAGVDTSIPEQEPGSAPTTLRQRLDEHRENPECSGCHARMDPIGFALENFDAIGIYREQDEQGLPIDATSEVEGEKIANATELSQLIAELPDVGACVARRFYEHAGGHLAGDGEEGNVEKLVEDFVDSNFDFKAMVVALVTNDGYRYAGPAGAGLEEETEQ